MGQSLDRTNFSALKFNEAISDKVDLACMPLLQNLGITHFGYIRVFQDGTMLRIANNQEWTRTYFENSYYNDLDLYSVRNVPENESRLSILSGEPKSDHCIKLCKNFNIWNALVMYENFINYYDFWFFASTPNNTQIINFYMNKINIFKKFTLNFKEQFSSDIQKNDLEKLIVSSQKLEHPLQTEKEKIKRFINDLNITTYQLEEELFISKKEFEYLFYLVQGKTSKEISRIMNISVRTIEFHLNNLKRKTHTFKKSEVIDRFLKNKIFCSLLV